MIPDFIISITRDVSTGLHPPYGKIPVRKIRYMGENYPNTVCLVCAKEACEDTKKHLGWYPKWNSVYSCYTATCEVCGDEAECTETWDVGRPTFDYMLPRLRARKIKKIMDK